MFSFFRRNSDDLYGKHIDIRQKGYIPGEQMWADQNLNKSMSNDRFLHEGKNFGQNKDYLISKSNSYPKMNLKSEKKEEKAEPADIAPSADLNDMLNFTI